MNGSTRYLLAFLQTQKTPIVIKADGLAAGKGVTVAEDSASAEQAVKEIFGGKFGKGIKGFEGFTF